MYSHMHVLYTGCMHTNLAGNALRPPNSCIVLASDAEELHAKVVGGKVNSILPEEGCTDDISISGG